MNITAKQPDRSNVVLMLPNALALLPDPGLLFGAYSSEKGAGSIYSDNPSMGTRICEFPAIGLQWVFEPGRVRLEDKLHRPPQESLLGEEMSRVIALLYPKAVPTAYGFNYDILYRMDNVIPVRNIMASFLKPPAIEGVRDFGWQYSVAKDKGTRSETYFFKGVSPIELSMHANFHFNSASPSVTGGLQAAFERCYAEADQAIEQASF